MLVSLVAIALIGAVAGLDFFQVFANGRKSVHMGELGPRSMA
jgi:hypothetical protein